MSRVQTAPFTLKWTVFLSNLLLPPSKKLPLWRALGFRESIVHSGCKCIILQRKAGEGGDEGRDAKALERAWQWWRKGAEKCEERWSEELRQERKWRMRWKSGSRPRQMKSKRMKYYRKMRPWERRTSLGSAGSNYSLWNKNNQTQRQGCQKLDVGVPGRRPRQQPPQ